MKHFKLGHYVIQSGYKTFEPYEINRLIWKYYRF